MSSTSRRRPRDWPGDGARAGLTRGNQFAFHINDLLEIGYAARADMLRAAHRFDKAGVIVGIQLLIAVTTLALKSAGRELLTVIGPFGISGDCHIMRICFIKSG